MDSTQQHTTTGAATVGSAWAYGLRISGLPDADARLLLPPPPNGIWPAMQVRLRRESPRLRGTHVAADRVVAELLDDEFAVMDRRARTATLRCRAAATDGRVVHPFLTAAAAAFAWWDGHDSFHGGAFVAGCGAWALLGDSEAGKSSLLAALGMAGHAVLADDLLVVDSRQAVLAGPRCVDLRPGAGAALAVQKRVTAVRGGNRLRIQHLPVAHEVPLRGWIVLGWSERLELRRLQPVERLQRLAQYRSFPPTDPAGLIELARIPGFELLRPRRWSLLEPAVDALLDLAAR